MQASQNPGARQDGFTLLELLVAVAILAVVATVAAPLVINRATGNEIEGAAQRMAAHLRLARSEAIRQGRDTHLTVDLARRQYWIANAIAVQTLPAGSEIDVTTVLPAAHAQAGHRATFHFRPDGSSGGGNIILRDATTAVHIELDWLSGNARITRRMIK